MPRPEWLSRNVAVLSGVSLLQDAASELLYPVLPIFLTVTLGAPAVAVGVVEGVAEAVAAGTKLLAGRRADRRGRRPLIALGYGLAAVGKVVVASAFVWPVVLAGRALDRVGKGVRGAPRDALLVVGAPPGTHGRVFGLHRAADTTGAVVGPAVGLLLYELLDHRIRPLLVVAVLPALLSVALVAFVREGGPPVRRGGPVSLRALPPDVRRLAVLLAAVALVNFPDALLLLRASDLGLSAGGVIGAYLVYNLVYAASAYPAGALSDRLPRHRVYAFGLGAFVVGYAGLGLASQPWQVFVLLPLYGLFAACTDGVGKAWVAGLAPAHLQASAQGLFQAMTGAAVLVAGLWAGLLWGADGRLPLLVAGGAGVVGVLAVLRLAPRPA